MFSPLPTRGSARDGYHFTPGGDVLGLIPRIFNQGRFGPGIAHVGPPGVHVICANPSWGETNIEPGTPPVISIPYPCIVIGETS